MKEINLRIGLLASIIFFQLQMLYAQVNSNCDASKLKEANELYKIGSFDQIINDLKFCLDNGFDTNQERVEGLRLLSLSYYAQDSLSNSEEYAIKIVEEDPDFNPDIFDPDYFKNAIARAKNFTTVSTVTSVSKKAESLAFAPASVNVINEQQIKRRGYLDLEAVLHDLPGFDISRSNGFLYSQIYQRGYRSDNTNRTLLLFDGVEENDLWSFNVYLSRQYSLSDVKNIEIVHGPTSTIYGANAFLGVINVNSKDPEDYIESGKNLGADIQAGYGSYNTRYVDGTIAVKSKSLPISASVTGRYFLSDEQDLSSMDNWNFEQFGTSQEYIDKMSLTDASSIESFFGSVDAPSPYYSVTVEGTDTTAVLLTEAGAQQAQSLDANFYSNPKARFSDPTKAWSVGTKIKFYDLILGYKIWGKDEATGAWYNDVRQAGGSYGENWSPIHQYFYLKFNKKVTSKLTISNFLRFKVHDFDEDTRLVGFRTYQNGRRSFSQLISDTEHSVDTLNFYQNSRQLRNELKFLITPTRNLDIVSGFEARFSSIQGDYYISNSTDIPEEEGSILLSEKPLGGNQFNSMDLGLYSQVSYKPIPILSVIAGIRYDYNQIRQNGGYGSVFNPRFSIVASPGKLILKAIYASAFLDANSRERYSTVAGQRELPNPNLQPERVKNLEFSIGTNLKNSAFSADITVYHSTYNNIIQSIKVPYQSGQTQQNNNIGEQKVIGVMSNAFYNVAKFQFYFNYTFCHSVVIDPIDADQNPILDENGNVVSEQEVGDIADHQVNIGGNYAYQDWLNFNLRFNIMGTRNTGTNTSVPGNMATFDPYIVGFASIQSKLPFWTALTLQITANNLFDTQYFSPGLRDANDARFSSGLPQNGRNINIRALLKF